MSKVQEDGAFTVIGLSKVVRNDEPVAIDALWKAFHAGDVRSKLGSDVSKDVYCVYHEYQGGLMDPYRMTIGHRAAYTEAPEGLYRADVPKQSVRVYDVEGPQPESLVAQWQAIWNGELDRSYLADYDVYCADQPEAVSVRVGVRSSQ